MDVSFCKLKIIIVLALLIATGLSCGDKEVYGINYQAQLVQFIEQDPDGIELYSQDIYPDSSETFALDDSEDRYFFMIDNVSRTYGYNIGTRPDTILGFYDVVDATVAINDIYTGDVYRIRDNDTSRAYGLESHVQRFAYFLKLYDNSYLYAGWRFRAYSCLNYSLNGYFLTSDNDTIRAFQTSQITEVPNRNLGGYIVDKNDIVSVPPGDSITYLSTRQERLYGETSDSDYKIYDNNITSGNKLTTGWKVPSSSDRFYHLITIDGDFADYSFLVPTKAGKATADSILYKSHDIIVPYAIGN